LILPVLLQGTPVEIKQERIVEKLKAIENIANIHDLHIWSLDETYNVLTAHITLNEILAMEKLAAIKKEIRLVLQAEKIQHVTIEFEIPNEECPSVYGCITN
jgi:cobalt-zinc-cadmium efflux system protein